MLWCNSGGPSDAAQPVATPEGGFRTGGESSFYMPANDGTMEVEVKEAILVKGTLQDHHEYPIIGRDSVGPIETQIRFSHF